MVTEILRPEVSYLKYIKPCNDYTNMNPKKKTTYLKMRITILKFRNIIIKAKPIA